ncbi:hypothetical protein C8J23_14018 [Shewanella chilikensis]|uniref:DUF11 domain-containing protein n=1 Tax=Shewanella chilikensis TaxID=558541 RepID=A0ABX5PIW3_9GAMM|nr:hypothetical protein [Shewanella chilikensis]MCL1152677.1 hypothetical protein [Shewanella chilikensis]PYE55165.1 hypothetical protein C8J23_14018 [Shewanella chilikensis]GGZ43432.1 hypothetical protein GCM10007105_32680 [Shewanella chilikensis]
MKLFQCNWLIRALGVVLIGGASLYGASSLTPVNASFFPQQFDQACMAEQAGFALNCTANDVRVSKVDNVRNLDGTTPVECVLGDDVTFLADVTITTTANQRYDYSVYLPEGSWSAQDSDPNNECSILLGRTNGPGVDLEENLDACADISKAAGYDATHVYSGEQITLFCRDDDNSGKAEFNYCAAWHNKTGADCSENNPAAPGTPSKCRCDAFDIDVFIKPNPPVINKKLITSNTQNEPGGTYTFELSFNNPNAQTSLFITSLSDEVDIGADGNYDTSLNLWSAGGPVGASDGVYLKSSNCTQPANGGEILPSGSYSCQFTVHIVDRDLPDLAPNIELYDDLIKLALEDKNGDDVIDSNSCAAVNGIDGEHCSNVVQVQVENLNPTITVLKTASPDQVPESGGNVTYTVRVNNTAEAYDSPLELFYLVDDKFGDLNGKGSCSTYLDIAYGSYYECSFTEFISGTGAGSHTNTVTAKAYDDEMIEAMAADSATVVINDIPSMITLDKSADPTSVLETGDDLSIFRDVEFTFLFGVKDQINGQNTVDTVTFNTLDDSVFGDLTAKCEVDTVDGLPYGPAPLAGLMLDPGHNASCTITLQVQGNRTDIHTNLATIYGTDEDGQAVDAMDDATVTFTPGSPAVDMDFAASMLVVLGMHNADVNNANLTMLTAAGVDVFPGADMPGFKLINSGGTFEGVNYGSCALNHPFGYTGSGTEDYFCAFTIEFKPGLENTDPIVFLGDVIVKLVNSKGDESTADVTIQVGTNEN